MSLPVSDFMATIAPRFSPLGIVYSSRTQPEAEFLDVIGTKVFLLAIQSLLLWILSPPPPLEQKWFETCLLCTVIVYGNLKSENSQDYAQKRQRNYTFMNLVKDTGS
jgi:hypothetical protein